MEAPVAEVPVVGAPVAWAPVMEVAEVPIAEALIAEVPVAVVAITEVPVPTSDPPTARVGTPGVPAHSSLNALQRTMLSVNWMYTEEEEDINSQDKTSSPDDSSSVGSMLIRHSTQDSRPLALSGVQMHESDVHVYRSERKLIQQMIGQPRKERRKTRCTYIQSIHHCVALTLALKSGVSVMIHEKNAMKKKKKQTCVGISEGSVPVPVLCLGSRTSNVLTKRA